MQEFNTKLTQQHIVTIL